MILGAIDIGSNAARLLITEVIDHESERPIFNKLNLFRVPIRLGFDVFEHGVVSSEKTEMLIQTLKAFRHIINAYQVNHFKVCATSAMRDAANAKRVLALINKETGLDIDIISGEIEANLIFENHIAENLDPSHCYMYIDVGGGSTEVSIFANGKMHFKKSFNIGTIRLLKEKVHQNDWIEMKEEIKNASKNQKELVAIGCGGNINKIFSMSKKKDGKPLDIGLLKEYYEELSSISIANRIQQFHLRQDRADVIVPALNIYINAMRWAGASKIFVPKIGLADGLIQHMWTELKYQLV